MVFTLKVEYIEGIVFLHLTSRVTRLQEGPVTCHNPLQLPLTTCMDHFVIFMAAAQGHKASLEVFLLLLFIGFLESTSFSPCCSFLQCKLLHAVSRRWTCLNSAAVLGLDDSLK